MCESFYLLRPIRPFRRSKNFSRASLLIVRSSSATCAGDIQRPGRSSENPSKKPPPRLAFFRNTDFPKKSPTTRIISSLTRSLQRKTLSGETTRRPLVRTFPFSIDSTVFGRFLFNFPAYAFLLNTLLHRPNSFRFQSSRFTREPTCLTGF